MKLLLDSEGHALLRDGAPVYLDATGNEYVANVGALRTKIAELNTEAKTNRERADAAEAKLSASASQVESLTSTARAALVKSAFAASTFIRDKFAIPPDMVQAKFERSFKVEGDKLVALDHDGSPLFSRARPGEPADFEEALALLVDSYEGRDSILRGSGASGGGARASASGPGSTQPQQISRAAFDAITNPAAKAAVARSTRIVD